jgi:hypothetical protein
VVVVLSRLILEMSSHQPVAVYFEQYQTTSTLEEMDTFYLYFKMNFSRRPVRYLLYVILFLFFTEYLECCRFVVDCM